MSLYDDVKENISCIDAAKQYGLAIDRTGKSVCVFHKDHRPSMKLYPGNRGYYCFACHASGSVIDLTAQLFDVTAKEAVEILARDFGISQTAQYMPRKKSKAQIEAELTEKLNHCLIAAAEYLQMIEDWLQLHPGADPESYCMMIEERDRAEYVTDILIYGSDIEKVEVLMNGMKEIEKYEQLTNKCKRASGRAETASHGSNGRTTA